ncbi:Bestrophin domain containing protein [Trichuris trichiura]|uniref:Bestrophin domain containing protein n=1 Tax=Trichuris trichiura TaxID=36087 RepID=A0A077Z078_TRITR|nr:Bestrophin domain containing protein [Trichuris trichiura]
MTISYTKECATVSLGNFLRLLFRWRGSIYKILLRETLIFTVVYYLINILYWYILDEENKVKFEHVATYFSFKNLELPLTFIMGFFVNQVYSRWSSNFKSLPWIDSMMIRAAISIHGLDERGRLLRRTLARYINLCCVIVLRDVSAVVKKRFPTWDHLVKTGIMTESEVMEYLMECKLHKEVYMYFLPLQWACNLVVKARKEERIDSDLMMVKLMQEIMKVRNSVATLIAYNWISLPLVYTQVVTIATHSFFVTNLIARQSTYSAGDREIESYFPAILLIQFLFYMGWLKVAEVLIIPFGEDDDDFEINYIVDRNVQVSYLMVDDYYGKIPTLGRDKHWFEEVTTIPHTVASMGLKRKPFAPSTADLKYFLQKIMTVTYSSSCSTATLSSFSRLLLLWRGSVYKIIFKDLFIFLAIYYTLNLTYHHCFTEKQQQNFKAVSVLFMKGNELIPITFVLSFFVDQVAKRWWKIFLTISWPDRAASIVSLYIKGTDERGRMIRRTLVRYINLSTLFVLRDISTAVKKRFPTMEHLVHSGFITETELSIFSEKVATYDDKVYMFWLPLQWACNLVTKAKKEERIESDLQYKTVMNEILAIRGNIGKLSLLDWVPVPLVYTQVVTIAVYSFFCLCLLSRQFNAGSKALESINVPFFVILEFIFYIGLLKVAQVLLNPFGEDDDDFELNYIIDRNLQLCYLVVDEYHGRVPAVGVTAGEPHGETAVAQRKVSHKRTPFKPSTAELRIPLRLQAVVEQAVSLQKRQEGQRPKMADVVNQVMRLRRIQQDITKNNGSV